MVDSSAAFERGNDGESYSGVNGDPANDEWVPRSIIPASDALNADGQERVSALVKMGALKRQAGDHSAAEELFRTALEIGEQTFGPDSPALIPALTGLSAARVMCGKVEVAEFLATRVVAVSENALTEQEPDLAIHLNELARLSLQQSAYSVAEPLLLRLLAMKRSKGEDHPEVGTVLASLATVRQALGRHESAEQLWRRVLEIRERTLAPNHFALAIALEHLGEACAARGKIGEALELLRRAQTIRQLTLGSGHPSLRESQDRIADLELQGQDALDLSPEKPPAPEPDRFRLLSSNSHSLIAAPAIVRERGAPPRRGTARVIEREPARAAEIPSIPTPSPTLNLAAFSDGPPQPDPTPYRGLLLSIQQEMGENAGTGEDAPSFAGAAFVASVADALKQRQKATMIGVGAIVLLGILATVSRGWTDLPATAVDASSLSGLRASPAPPPAEASPGAFGFRTNPGSAPAVAASGGTPVTASRTRIADQRPAPKKATEKREQPTGIAIPKVSSALTRGFDSLVRARGGSGSESGDLLLA
ncbi:MAG: tetratricopeptide repeat protein, partial [Gemmatimonadota bacterium]|nr:tetratricopeptide repeat protein [Gemmatimonadota bacterium]